MIRRSFFPQAPYLFPVPCFSFVAIFLNLRLILASHLIQDLIEIARGCRIHLHSDAVTKLRAKGAGLLEEKAKKKKKDEECLFEAEVMKRECKARDSG